MKFIINSVHTRGKHSLHWFRDIWYKMSMIDRNDLRHTKKPTKKLLKFTQDRFTGTGRVWKIYTYNTFSNKVMNFQTWPTVVGVVFVSVTLIYQPIILNLYFDKKKLYNFSSKQAIIELFTLTNKKVIQDDNKKYKKWRFW